MTKNDIYQKRSDPTMKWLKKLAEITNLNRILPKHPQLRFKLDTTENQLRFHWDSPRKWKRRKKKNVTKPNFVTKSKNCVKFHVLLILQPKGSKTSKQTYPHYYYKSTKASMPPTASPTCQLFGIPLVVWTSILVHKHNSQKG